MASLVDSLDRFEEWVGRRIYRPLMCKMFGHEPREDGVFVRCWRCSAYLTQRPVISERKS